MAGCGLESQMLGIGSPFFDQIVEYAPKGPKGAPKGPKGVSKRPKGTPKGPKGAHKGPKGTPKGPKGAPKGSYCFRRKHASYFKTRSMLSYTFTKFLSYNYKGKSKIGVTHKKWCPNAKYQYKVDLLPKP